MEVLRIAPNHGMPDPPSEWRPCLTGLAGRVAAAHPLGLPVQVILADDAYLKQLNAAYRGKDETTDVLSFDLDAPDLPTDEPVPSEVYISVERAAAQAAEQQVPIIEELARLLVHGLLHLAGFEHDTPDRLRHMEEETEEFLRAADLPPAPVARGCQDQAPGLPQ